MFLETLILFAVFLLLSEVLKPKPKTEQQRPAGLGDFNFPTATEGRPVPIFWGTVKLSGPNVLWYGNLRQKALTEKVKTGLFSSKKVTKGYQYYIGIQFGLGRGGSAPVNELRRVWIGDTEVFNGSVSVDGDTLSINEPDLFGGNDLGSGGVVGTLRFHSGSYTQSASAYLSTQQVIGSGTPAYRGTSYVTLEDGYIGNGTNVKPWAFECRRIPNPLGLATPSVNSGNDANPMNVLFEILTNFEWGLGQPSSDIDTANFTAQAATLLTEGNGFSFVLDGKVSAESLVKEIERQIDGVLYVDRTTGKWTVSLARGGYTLSAQTAIGPSNIVKIESFSRGSWQDTQNSVLVRFNNRSLDYKDTYAAAQDMANVRLQGNVVVSVEQSYPGVKDPTLANNIAWRNLRTLAYPLARATIVCDRAVYNKNPGDILRWTDPDLGLVDLPMRITKIDLGTLTQGQITVTLVEDVFVYDLGVFTAPGSTMWTPPPQNVIPIPVLDSLIFEAPRKFVTLDPAQPGVLDRVWCGARFQGDSAVNMDVVTRPNAGSYTDGGDVSGFLVAGSLNASMSENGTQGSISITLTPSPESLALLTAALEAAVSAADVGNRLANLVLVGSEFMGFTTVAPSGPNLVLSGGYRALLDTAPAAHAASDRVWVLLGNLTDRVFASGTTVNVKLLPRSRTQTLPEASATATNVVMADRGRRPYPPVNLTFNTSLYPAGAVSIDSSGSGGPGSGLDDRGIAAGFTRRDYRNSDEAAAVVNESSLLPDFPAADSTEYAVEVRNDPAGANTLLFTTAYQSTTPVEISRTKILRNTAGVVPSTLRMTVLTRHTYEGVQRAATQSPRWDFSVSSTLLSGDFNWGVRAQNSASSNYSAVNTGTFTLNIGTALGAGAVEVSVAGGGFTPVITAGNTTGTFSATSGQTISIRHTQAGSNTSETFLEMTFGGTSIAYAVLTY